MGWDLSRTQRPHFLNIFDLYVSLRSWAKPHFGTAFFLRGHSTGALHTLSQELLNLVLNRQDVLGANYASGFILRPGRIPPALRHHLCRTYSLAVMLNKKQVLKEFFATSPRCGDIVRVESAGLSADFAVEEVGALLIDEPKERRDQSMMALSLRQLAVQSLLSCCVVEVDGHTLKATKPGRMSDDVFHRLSHACLIGRPQLSSSQKQI